MKYQYVVSTSYRQFDELIHKEMAHVAEKRRLMYKSVYDSVKHDKENVNVIRMKQLMEEGEDTEILKMVHILLRIKKELKS